MADRPVWDEDDPADGPLVLANCAELVDEMRAAAADRVDPGAADLRAWHARLYRGCRVPVDGFLGHFRGDEGVAELRGYEVEVGTKRGLPAAAVTGAVDALLAGMTVVLGELDTRLPIGRRPRDAADLVSVLRAMAIAHGEWIRIHPYANGNGRTARLWVAFLALRYSVPMFLDLKPRPEHSAYRQAAMASMGEPPFYTGDHDPTFHLFARRLRRTLETG